MTRDNPRTPKFGTMVVEPPPRKHSGTMVLEAPKVPPPRSSSPPPFEPTEILGADFGHLAMLEEQTSIASPTPSGPSLPFAPTHGTPPTGPRPDQPIPSSPWDPGASARPRVRSGGIYSTAELTLAPAAPAPRALAPKEHATPAPTARAPEPPAYLGPIARDDRREASSPFRNEPIGETPKAPTPRPSPPPPRGDARNDGHARLTALLQGPWLFPNEDD